MRQFLTAHRYFTRAVAALVLLSHVCAAAAENWQMPGSRLQASRLPTIPSGTVTVQRIYNSQFEIAAWGAYDQNGHQICKSGAGTTTNCLHEADLVSAPYKIGAPAGYDLEIKGGYDPAPLTSRCGVSFSQPCFSGAAVNISTPTPWTTQPRQGGVVYGHGLSFGCIIIDSFEYSEFNFVGSQAGADCGDGVTGVQIKPCRVTPVDLLSGAGPGRVFVQSINGQFRINSSCGFGIVFTEVSISELNYIASLTTGCAWQSDQVVAGVNNAGNLYKVRDLHGMNTAGITAMCLGMGAITGGQVGGNNRYEVNLGPDTPTAINGISTWESSDQGEFLMSNMGSANYLIKYQNGSCNNKMNITASAVPATPIIDSGTCAGAAGTPTGPNLTVLNNVSYIGATPGPALLRANNLSDLPSAATARTNLGVTATGADTTYAFRANNLSDLANAATARTNLGVTATGADTTYNFRANNLSDVASVISSRSNLGVTATGADTTYAFRASNLSDLASASTARTNLGLGALATVVPGTGIAAWLATPSSANLLAALTTKTGTGNAVFGTSPTLVTPVLGVAAGTSIALGSCTIGTYSLCGGGILLDDGTNNNMIAGGVGGVSTIDLRNGGTGKMILTNSFGYTFSSSGGPVNIANTTDASASSGSGAFQVSGGGSVAKRFWLPAITTSAGLQTAVLCQSSGGEVIADSVACLASSEGFKEDIKPSDMGLNTILALRPITYRYKLTGNERFDSAPNQRDIHAGFLAEEVASIDPRLVAHDANGKIRTVRPDGIPAALVKAVQELKARTDDLRLEIGEVKAKIAVQE